MPHDLTHTSNKDVLIFSLLTHKHEKSLQVSVVFQQLDMFVFLTASAVPSSA